MGELRQVIFRGTTVLAVRKDGKTAMAGDGQVTMNRVIVKHTASKLRRLFEGKVVAGFAGSGADALTLFERFEKKLQSFSGNLPRAALELVKDWRMDKALRRLEALLLVADKKHMFLLSGGGDIIEPEEGICGIGSGGEIALSAAKAMLRHAHLTAEEIAREALGIAASIDVYTNDQITVEVVGD